MGILLWWGNSAGVFGGEWRWHRVAYKWPERLHGDMIQGFCLGVAYTHEYLREYKSGMAGDVLNIISDSKTQRTCKTSGECRRFPSVGRTTWRLRFGFGDATHTAMPEQEHQWLGGEPQAVGPRGWKAARSRSGPRRATAVGSLSSTGWIMGACGGALIGIVARAYPRIPKGRERERR